MTREFLRSRRVAIWALFMVVALMGFALAISGWARRQNAARSAEILRTLIARDLRFKNVRVSCETNGRVYLRGEVASKDDLFALRDLVAQANLPTQPVFCVRFYVELPKPAAGRAGFAPLLTIGHHQPSLPEPVRSLLRVELLLL